MVLRGGQSLPQLPAVRRNPSPSHELGSEDGPKPSQSRTQVRQIPDRGSTDWDAIAQVLDHGILAHVAFCVDAQPFVLPMLYARSGRTIFLHGSVLSRLMFQLSQGIDLCVGVTLLDGLVLARSAFHHSMNYRSAVAFGSARPIQDARARILALRRISEHLLPGRWADVRGPNKRELEQTCVLAMSVEEASLKIRSGPVLDDPGDYLRPTWAGVLPIVLKTLVPVPDDSLQPGTVAPDYLLQAAARFSCEAPDTP